MPTGISTSGASATTTPSGNSSRSALTMSQLSRPIPTPPISIATCNTSGGSGTSMI